jgi:hypothetical protein
VFFGVYRWNYDNGLALYSQGLFYVFLETGYGIIYTLAIPPKNMSNNKKGRKMIHNFYDFDDTIGIQDYTYFFATFSMEKSLENSQPLRSLDDMVRQFKKGEAVFVLTARPFSKSGQRGIQLFLRRYGIVIPKSSIFMVGGAGEPKAQLIEKYLPIASKIRFYDDLPENINAVKEMAIKNNFDKMETYLIK